MYKSYKITDVLVQRLNQSNISNKATNDKCMMRSSLLEMISANSTIEASEIWNNWFPEIEADVFISHSSKDYSIAKKLSKWLLDSFNIKSFIDSDIWGHSNALLKEIDNLYCLNPDSETYCYEKRNLSTAHVHMILSYAITRMIEKTECFIFIETHNSLSIDGNMSGISSPWIFHELSIADTIELKMPNRQLKKATQLS